MMTPNNQGKTRNAKGQFLPGVNGSGGKGGRPPMPAELKELYQAKAEEALAIADALMKDKEQPGAVRLRAAEYITDRGYGKPTQPSEISGEGGGPVIIKIGAGAEPAD